MHPAHAGSQFKWAQDVVHGIAIGIASVGALGLTGGNHATPVLSRKLVPSGAAGKAAGQHSVQPLLQQCRAAPRIKRVLENNHLMLAQQILLVSNIDKKIWVVCIEIVHGDIRQL